MNPRFARIAGPLAGILLAATLAAPVLATSNVTTAGNQSGAAAAAAAAATATGPARCAADRLAARANPTVANLQAVGYCEVDRRLATLRRLRTMVNEAGALTEAHRAALTSILDGSTAGLTALRGKIAAETTAAAVRDDIGHIFTDYRIYVLVTRQVHLVRLDDRIDAAADRLTNATTRLELAITTAEGNGKDVTVARQHLAAMQSAIDSARSAVAGDADAVLGLTPAGWNAGTAKPVLDAARASVAVARSDARTAVSEARAVLVALR